MQLVWRLHALDQSKLIQTTLALVSLEADQIMQQPNCTKVNNTLPEQAEVMEKGHTCHPDALRVRPLVQFASGA